MATFCFFELTLDTGVSFISLIIVSDGFPAQLDLPVYPQAVSISCSPLSRWTDLTADHATRAAHPILSLHSAALRASVFACQIAERRSPLLNIVAIDWKLDSGSE